MEISRVFFNKLIERSTQMRRLQASRDELISLGECVFNEVKASIAPEAQRIITENLGGFDKYLRGVIEDTVRKVKQSDPYITLQEGVVVNEDVSAQ